MTLPTPRIFTNDLSIPYDTLLNRLLVNDVSVRIDFSQSVDEEGIITNQVVVLSSSLTNEQIETDLSTIQSQAEADALARKAVARVSGLSVSQLGNATPSGISSYITTQITNDVAKTSAINAINNISTSNLATAVGQIKTILTGLVNAQYAAKDFLILQGMIDAYIRDQIWPN